MGSTCRYFFVQISRIFLPISQYETKKVQLDRQNTYLGTHPAVPKLPDIIQDNMNEWFSRIRKLTLKSHVQRLQFQGLRLARSDYNDREKKKGR